MAYSEDGVAGIYRIISTVSGRVYIGSSIYTNRRIRQHKARLSTGGHYNSRIQREYDKYGEASLEYEVIFSYTGSSRSELYTIEQEFLDEYKPELNLISRVDVVDDDKLGFEIDQYTNRGTYLQTFVSAAQASRELGLNQVCINNCVRGDSPQTGGFLWSRKGELPRRPTGPVTTSKGLSWGLFMSYGSYKIYQYSLKGELIKTWNHIEDICSELGILRKVLMEHIFGKRSKSIQRSVFSLDSIFPGYETNYSKRLAKPIVMTKGEEVLTFSSLKEAGDHFGVWYSTIADYFAKNKSFNGYIITD
jgi:hypothetical protein